MKHLGIVILIVAYLTNAGLSQKRAEKWFFGGNGAGLDFSCSPPFPISGNTGYHSNEGCSSISDEQGNLLFYANGEKVWNQDHLQMPNGFDIGESFDCWGSSTQGALIIPHPGNADLYYIFTTDCAEAGQNLDDHGFRYSIVDMTEDNGFGDVIVKGIELFDNACEKLAAVYHEDGQSVWVLMHEYGTDAFRCYLIDENGLDTNPVISHQGVVQIMYDDLPSCWGISSKRGYMKFSPQGDKLIVVSTSDCHPYPHPVEMFQFDDSSGEVSLQLTLSDPDSVKYYGASFSPDGNLLYLSKGWYGYSGLYQFDLSSNDPLEILNSRVTLYEWSENTPTIWGAIQIGPDGQIYVAQNNTTIGVIHNPNIYGVDCDYQYDYISLANCPKDTYSDYGLPNFIESYFLNSYQGQNCSAFLEADFTFSEPLLDQPTQFTDNSSGYPIQPHFWQWDFDDPFSGNNNSTEQNPTHIFNEPGTYNVTLITISDTIEYSDNIGDPCMVDSLTISIIILPITVSQYENAQQWNAYFSSNDLFIEMADYQSQSEVFLHDPVGRLIWQMHCSKSMSYNCNALASGVYFISIETRSGILETRKLIKSQ